MLAPKMLMRRGSRRKVEVMDGDRMDGVLFG